MARGPTDARTGALAALLEVFEHGRSLDRALEDASGMAPRERALAHALAYGVIRDHLRLQAILDRLLDRPLKRRDRDVELLMLMGLFQLEHHRAPDYAVVSAAVDAAAARGKPWARGLINAVLRNFVRRRERLLAALPDTPELRYSTPAWMVERLRGDWPDHWQAVLAAGQTPGPMVLRVNLARLTRAEYLAALDEVGLSGRAADYAPGAVELDRPCEVERLPGFARGDVSVQDGAAQAAALLLGPVAGRSVLDACAAPGGKTLHLLESRPGPARLVAVESDAARARRIGENLARGRIDEGSVTIRVADAAELPAWWDGRPFDRVLLDAPCSGTGVIRRHPDIKLLRRPADVETLAGRQARLLASLWRTVAPGGVLLYCTCSVFRAENALQVERFLQAQADAGAAPLSVPGAAPDGPGAQILPGSENRDGFYYALLHKR